ncbi:RDD family protein [Mycolicibacterium thermoresistibile]
MTSGYGQPYPGPYGGYPPGPGPAAPGPLVTRFFARLIDGIFVMIIAAVLPFAFDADIWVTGMFSGAAMFVYFLAFEITAGWTPGKKLLGLSVRGAGGAAKPDPKQSAIRNAFTLLPIIPIIGGLLAVIAYIVIAVTIGASSTKQGKHDRLAGGTQVVKS